MINRLVCVLSLAFTVGCLNKPDLICNADVMLSGSISGITSEVKQLDLNGDGHKEYSETDLFRGTNVVLSIIRDNEKCTYTIPAGGHTFLGHDDDGDGRWDHMTVMKGLVPIESFQRNEQGKWVPLSTAELLLLKRSCQNASDIAIGIVEVSRKVKEGRGDKPTSPQSTNEVQQSAGIGNGE